MKQDAGSFTNNSLMSLCQREIEHISRLLLTWNNEMLLESRWLLPLFVGMILMISALSSQGKGMLHMSSSGFCLNREMKRGNSHVSGSLSTEEQIWQMEEKNHAPSTHKCLLNLSRVTVVSKRGEDRD